MLIQGPNSAILRCSIKKRLFATAIVALAFVGTATGTASAESQSEAVLVNEVMNSGNPQETYNALSKKDKAVFLRAMSPSSVEQSVSAQLSLQRAVVAPAGLPTIIKTGNQTMGS